MNIIYIIVGGLVSLIALFISIGALRKQKKSGKVLTTLSALALLFSLISGGANVVNASELRKWNESKSMEYAELIEELSAKQVVEYGDTWSLSYDKEQFNELWSDSFTASELGEYKVNTIIEDAEGYILSIKTEIEVQDTVKPTIEGIENHSIYIDEDFDVNELGITASDPVDGKLEVTFSGDVDTSVEGITTITVSAVDSNDNKAEETFDVEVIPAPVKQTYQAPVQQAAAKQASGSDKQSTSSGSSQVYQDLQTIRFHNSGRVVPYQNRGSATGQEFIDANPWHATTWDNYGMSATHANRDGGGTYFAAHAHGGFSVAMWMSAGERVTVRDHTGDYRTFEVVLRHEARLTQDADGYLYNNDEWLKGQMRASYNDELWLQTCLNVAGTHVAFTKLVPIN